MPMPIVLLSAAASLSALLPAPVSASAFVISPSWVDAASNPCSERSWQLLLWPDDGKCYPIFERGPCPDTQELAFDVETKRAQCRCPKNLILWPQTNRCYPEFSKGPCEPNQYLTISPESSAESPPSKNKSLKAKCVEAPRCEPGWVYWPSSAECQQLYTQGPCHKGDLLMVNPSSGEAMCGCDPLLLRQYFFPPLRLCYEHLTRGPCEAGMLFAYNHTSESTHCMCSNLLDNYDAVSGGCYQFGTKGACGRGQDFVRDEADGRGVCACKAGYVLWAETGQCYKAFTPGPCQADEFIVPDGGDAAADAAKSKTGRLGVCVTNPCPPAHLYFPTEEADSSVKCHKVGSRGPCPHGQLVVFEKYSGKSYRGECGCSSGYNQNYWPATGECFEWHAQGPCSGAFTFAYDRAAGVTNCACERSLGRVFWNETQQCYEAFTQGPCPEHALIVPGDENDGVFCECSPGFRFSPDSYSCVASAASTTSLRRPTSSQWPRSSWAQGVFVTAGRRVASDDVLGFGHSAVPLVQHAVHAVSAARARRRFARRRPKRIRT